MLNALLDPGVLCTFGSAVGILVYGTQRGSELHHKLDGTHDGNSGIITVDWKMIVAFTISGSATLLLFFYFLQGMQAVMLFLVTFVGIYSVGYTLKPALKPTGLHYPIPFVGNVERTDVHLVLMGILSVVVWRLSGEHWVMNDWLAGCISVTALSFYRVNSFKLAFAFSAALLIYDCFWVFGSKPIFGRSVMAHVAKTIRLPALIMFPRLSGGFALLGLGDIVLPGIGLECFLRFDQTQAARTEHPESFGYFKIGMIGYVLGLLCANVAVATYQIGQPALLYIVPLVNIPVLYFSWSRGDFWALWHGQNTSTCEEVM